jgi:hypothetical protein
MTPVGTRLQYGRRRDKSLPQARQRRFRPKLYDGTINDRNDDACRTKYNGNLYLGLDDLRTFPLLDGEGYAAWVPFMMLDLTGERCGLGNYLS